MVDKNRLNGAWTNTALAFASIILGALLIEAFSWLWVTQVRSHHPTRWEYRASRPPPYQNADYFSRRFVLESIRSSSGQFMPVGTQSGQKSDVIVLKDVKGRFFNVSNGVRRTVGAPSEPTKKVIMFGGSTLFGQEVPDHLTIASYLQGMLNEKGMRWSVINRGVPAMNVLQQTKILEQLNIPRGSIVVYYDGVNDIYYNVFSGFRHGLTKNKPSYRPVHKLSDIQKNFFLWHLKLKEYSFTADIALDIFNRAYPYTVTDQKILSSNIEFAGKQFRNSIVDASMYTEKHGAMFVHFLQPHVFSLDKMTDHERTIIKNPLETPPGIDIAFYEGYPILRKVALALARQGIRSYDISDVLDARSGEEVFLDFAHVNHHANQLIAERMMREYFALLISQKG